jgi:tetratricopeptide (TPR) repeat protein
LPRRAPRTRGFIDLERCGVADRYHDLAQAALSARRNLAAGAARQLAGACAEAISLYGQAIAADPSFSNVYAQLALCLYDHGHVDEAVARWREALQRDPLSPDALAGLGVALYVQGQREAGLAYYRQAVSLDSRYADETYLRTETLWGGSIIFDSRPLRQQPGL